MNASAPVPIVPATHAETTSVSWRRLDIGIVLLLVAVAAFMLLAQRILGIGAEDFGVAGLFSTDEQLAGTLVRAMLDHGNFGLSHFFSYGPLDLYVARLLLWPPSLVSRPSDHAILLTLRLVSLAGGAGSLALTYFLAWRLWDRSTAVAATILLAVSPTLFAWSTIAHPDSVQLLLLLVGLNFALNLCMRSERRSLLLASLFASLAFASKYGGFLLLPPIWAADAAGKNAVRGWIWTWAIDVALSFVVFVVAFLAVDPNVFGEPRRFISQALNESSLAHSGHLFTIAPSPAGWLKLLASNDLFGLPGLALAVAGLVGWVVSDIIRKVPSMQGRMRLLMALWTLGYLLFLLIWVSDRQARYALPILPGLALFAASSLVWLARHLPLRGFALTVLLLLTVTGPSQSLLSYEQGQAKRLQDPTMAQRIAAGHWLGSNFDMTTPVLYDAYAYVPSRFSNSEESFGMTRAQIAFFSPQVIVTDIAIDSRFQEPSLAATYRDGPLVYDEISATYQALADGSFPCFELLQDFGPERIYARANGGPSDC